MITKIILILTAGILVLSLLNHRQQDMVLRDELIKQFSKRLFEKETETKKLISQTEQKIKIIETVDKETQKRIETAEHNYKNIMRNLKKTDHDKNKKDLEIINSDSDSDWKWFTQRFPKSKNDNELPIETDTIIGESVQNGQSEGD